MQMERRLKYFSFLLGITATLWQIILFRECMAIFYGNELIIGLLLSGWLLAFALGCKTGESSEKRIDLEQLPLLFLCLSILCYITIKHSRILLDIPVGEFIPLPKLVLLALPLLGVPCFVLGLWFQKLAAALSDMEYVNPAATVYTYESFGAVVAGLFFIFILTGLHSNLYSLFVLCSIVLVGYIFLYRRSIYLLTTAALVIFVAIAGKKLETGLNQRYWQSLAPGMTFIEGHTSRYGELAVLDWGGEKTLYSNGLKQTQLPDSISAQTLSALVLTQHPHPRRLLLIGGGLGGFALQMSRCPELQVYYLEQDADAFQLASRYYQLDPRARYHTLFIDARRYLLQPQQPFDEIIVNVGRPTTALINRYYTVEFFAQAKKNLTADGVLALCAIPSGENYIGPELLQINASMYHDLSALFADVLVVPGDQSHFFAAKQFNLLSRRADTLTHRYQQLHYADRYFHPSQFGLLLADERLQFRQHELAYAPSMPNSDFQPINYLSDMRLWLKQVSGLFWSVHRIPNRVLVIPLLMGFLIWLVVFVHRPVQTCLGSIIMLAGFAGMALNLILLFMMQNLFGYVYVGMGLALAAFMSGLAIAASVAQRIDRHPTRWLLGMVVCLMTLLLLLNPLLHVLDRFRSMTFLIVLLFSSGALTGGLFPLAGQVYPMHNNRRQTGILYAADLVGGSIGSILVSGAIIPLYGYTGASRLLVGTGVILLLLTLVLFHKR
jgi:spermidine synthase